MTKWDYIRSVVIFVIAVFILNDFFISLSWVEAIILTIFTAISIFHTVDIRDDIMAKVAKRRYEREGYTGPERRKNRDEEL